MGIGMLDNESAGWAIRRRIVIALAIMWLGLSLLLFRTWYLQVLHHDKYSAMAKNNRIRVVMEKPERGRILDRNGVELVVNKPSHDLALVLDDVGNLAETADRVGALLGLKPEAMIKAARRQRRTIPYLPVTVRKGLTLKQVAQVEWAHIPGVIVLAETQREYRFGNTASHLLGYVGEISEKQMGNDRYDGVLPGTRIGQYGTENSFDEHLRGVRGMRSIEVDAKGFEVGLLGRQAPQVGNDVYLTLDIEVQKAAEKALGDRGGAVVALEPDTGRIIAMVSHPGFDPGELSRGILSARWQAIVSNPERPLLNRVVQGVYPPGSIFKIAVAAAVLEKGHGGREVFCTGRYPFLDRTFRVWKLECHGFMGLHEYIVQSCDVFFYEQGDRVGIDAIADYAMRFGFGRKTGIDLPSERVGLIPTTKWKKEALGTIWYPGETLSAAIGQGYVGTTPMQVAVFMGIVGASGAHFLPVTRQGLWDNQKNRYIPVEPEALDPVALRPSTYRTLQRAMRGVVWQSKGTARAARSAVVDIAGKTGTAQVVGMDDEDPKKQKDLIRKHRDHAWFGAFAPVKDPKIAVAVIVEHGGHGGAVAAPVAREVIEAYMTQRETYVPPAEMEQFLTEQRQVRPGA